MKFFKSFIIVLTKTIKATFGSNTHGLGAGDITWSNNMAKECGLTKDDFFIPERNL